MKILFVASECVPFIKTGGLADVVGALPFALRECDKDADVRVMLPMYAAMDESFTKELEHVADFHINLGWRRQYVGIETLEYNGVRYYFIDNKQYFGRDYVYGGGDEGERFAFFCRAVPEAIRWLNFMPDIVHCNDWQTGLVPVLIKAKYSELPGYSSIKCVFTIHNLQYQGLFSIGDIEEMLSLGDWAYTNNNLEFFGMCSFMKGGIVFSDAITTVSPTYAQEIQTAYYGEKLDGLLRSRSEDMHGILNGIDLDEYDPETDAALEQNYTHRTFSNKLINKRALQKEFGLTEDDSIPVIGMVSRLSGQKGLDLVECVLTDIVQSDVELCVLGMGEQKYIDLFNWAQWKFPGRVSVRYRMDPALSRRIYAGSDMFLMPSMFEPCGLSQMIALRYGTLPIARETGGLRDTVLSYNEYTGEGNGFTFLNYNAHDMLNVIRRAVNIYREDRHTWDMLAMRAMNGDYGWERSAKEYLKLYKALVK